MIAKMKLACSGINMKLNAMYTTNMKSREMLVNYYENVSITLIDYRSQVLILLLMCFSQIDQSTFRRNVKEIIWLSVLFQASINWGYFSYSFSAWLFILFVFILSSYCHILVMKHLNNIFLKYMFLQYLGKYDMHNCMFI
jgi:hypothetical protein